MRFLKNKIQASLEAQKQATNRRNSRIPSNKAVSSEQDSQVEQPTKYKAISHLFLKRRKRRKGRCITPKIYLQSKNIVTNFGKAMVSFAGSELATPYLVSILEKLNEEGEAIEMKDFMEFMKCIKGSINSIESVRSLVVAEENDSDINIRCKKVFGLISEVFIKCFSVNWIIHGRVTYKMVHLKFRYKMLRKIKNPSTFISAKLPGAQFEKEQGLKVEEDVKTKDQDPSKAEYHPK